MSAGIRRTLDENQIVYNGWLSIPSGFAAEVISQFDWGSLTVDLQHGIQDYRSMVEILQGVAARGIPVLARLSGNDGAEAAKALDAGAAGLICPMVNSADEAASFVRACRYPPAGDRSFGPTRAALGQPRDRYPRRANDEIVCFAMIETRSALDAVDQIAAVDGVDGLYVGPADLSLSLGLEPRQDSDEPALIEALETVVGAARRHAVTPGIHTASPVYARRMAEAGFRFITLGSDVGYLAGGAREAIAAVRGAEHD